MRYYLTVTLLILICSVRAQDLSLDMQKPVRLSDSEQKDLWSQVPAGLNFAVASTGLRFDRELPPSGTPDKAWNATAWRNEKIATQLLLFSSSQIKHYSIKAGALKNERGDMITANNLSIGALNYVMTDEFGGGCGYRKAKDFDSSYVADMINTGYKSSSLAARNTQPFWIDIKVPETARPGLYRGKITITTDKDYTVLINMRVIGRKLPDPAKWSFRLDLWQHPAAVARVHKVTMWSDEHFSLMRKYYTSLAAAGQKTITASIVNEPWNHQTYDDYPGLIKWTKKRSGAWTFDYSLFDRYIAFVMSCGINQRINCYSMVPWKIAFRYYDESANKETEFTGKIGSPEYNQFWSVMLTDFTAHLKSKGWFDITTIAMDERPMEDMKAVIALLKSVDKNWKIALAGEYHQDIEKDIFDYCVASKWTFPDDVLLRRQAEGKASTWYTCCTEKYPNLFTFSVPAEGRWIGWYTAAKKMDGYVRWAFNSWPKDPLNDSRFTAWPAGDTFMIYPGPYSSIRFENLLFGAQDFEKIRLLREDYMRRKQTDKLMRLNKSLENFDITNLSKESADITVKKFIDLLNPTS